MHWDEYCQGGNIKALLAQRQKEYRTKPFASCGTPVDRLTNGIADKTVSPFSVDFRRNAGKKMRQDNCVEFIRASLMYCRTLCGFPAFKNLVQYRCLLLTLWAIGIIHVHLLKILNHLIAQKVKQCTRLHSSRCSLRLTAQERMEGGEAEHIGDEIVHLIAFFA